MLQAAQRIEYHGLGSKALLQGLRLLDQAGAAEVRPLQHRLEPAQVLSVLCRLFLCAQERRLPTPPAACMAFSFSSSFRCLLAMLSDSDDAVTLADELRDDDDAKMA